jgi:hypothetical protein
MVLADVEEIIVATNLNKALYLRAIFLFGCPG